MRKVSLRTLKGLARGQANQFSESFFSITFWALVEEERDSEQMGQKNRRDRGCSGDREPLRGGHGPFGQFSHVQAPLAGLCHPGAHYCHLPACALGSSEDLRPRRGEPRTVTVSEFAGVGGTEGWA